jgi:hypothetical protein
MSQFLKEFKCLFANKWWFFILLKLGKLNKIVRRSEKKFGEYSHQVDNIVL